MSWWTLDPLDPLMVRDGRPFSTESGGARSLGFPPPSVVAGAIRTRVGFAARAPGQHAFALKPENAQQIEVAGPLLASEKNGQLSLQIVAPRDAVLYEGDAQSWPRYRLAPGAPWSDGAHSDLGGARPLLPLVELPVAKPAKDAPAFWSEAAVRAWMSAPPAADRLARADGAKALEHERRVHLSIDPRSLTGEDGKLFSTDGLRLTDPEGNRRVFLVRADAPLAAGLLPVGGERRLSRIETARFQPWEAPKLTGDFARVLLLTPAIFSAGAMPSAIFGAPVLAAATGRAEAISGWDLENGRPKRVRRASAAGTVLWVTLPSDPAARAAWVEQVHWRCISDLEQDRRDGFGLAIVGVEA